MKATKLLVAILSMLAITGMPDGSYAQNITVDIGPGICTKGPGPSPLDISGPCGNIAITPLSAGLARVEMIDGNADMLRLMNVRITATQPVSNFHIKFWRDFGPGPNTSSNPLQNVWYKTTADGAFTPATNGNSITANSFVTNPVGGAPKAMGSVSYTVSGGVGTFGKKTIPNPQWGHTPELTGNRTLTVDMVFTLQTANDKLDLGIGVKLINATSAGRPGGEEDPCEELKGKEKKKCEMERGMKPGK